MVDAEKAWSWLKFCDGIRKESEASLEEVGHQRRAWPSSDVELSNTASEEICDLRIKEQLSTISDYPYNSAGVPEFHGAMRGADGLLFATPDR